MATYLCSLAYVNNSYFANEKLLNVVSSSLCSARFILGIEEAWPESLKHLTRMDRSEFVDCIKEMMYVTNHGGADNVVKMFSTEKVIIEIVFKVINMLFQYLHISNIEISPQDDTM